MTLMHSLKRLLAGCCLVFVSTLAWSLDSTTGETPEIQYSSALAGNLYAQAQNLGTPLYIYQYLRNNAQFALYHGSVSGSINTYGGLRGNDVDLASTLIAMLRAKGTPARYVVGTVQISASQLMNWLGVQDLDLAAQLLNDQGIQGVSISSDRSTVNFEHVWVEAQVPYDNYRGIRSQAWSTNCTASPTGCQWVALDPSFKQKLYGTQNIDLHDAIAFDYTAYYNAIKNDDQTRINKNPLDIFEEQTLAYLRDNMPGTTLEDVINTGQILTEENGLLPSSLPYAVTGALRRYNSVADHDAQVPAVESKKWRKTLSIVFTFYNWELGLASTATYATLSTVDVANERLTVSYNTPVGQLEIKLGGTLVANLPVNTDLVGLPITEGTLYDLTLSMDIAPSTTDGVDDFIATATYQNMVFGGYYLISSGGEQSNWSQVHRAAEQLLAANQQYKIVLNPAETGCQLPEGYNCTPYLDSNANGWDASDPKLGDTPEAMDALTGGLLYVASTQYFTKMREKSERLNALRHTKTPIAGYLGVVSSVGTPEYIAGTAFSILPGGLLIDMKGLATVGSWRIGQANAYSTSTFQLQGHIGSSLEHEIWQELIGYDAVSTVRGIQMALAAGASLQHVKKNASENTLPAFYTAVGFESTVPAGFSYAPLTVFATQEATWTNADTAALFDVMKSDINTSTPLLRLYRAAYSYGLYSALKCIDDQENFLISYPLPSPAFFYQFCGDSVLYYNYADVHLSRLSSFYYNTFIPTYIGQTYLDIFDQAKGFVTSEYVYRKTIPPVDAHSSDTVDAVRSTVSLQTDGWAAEFTIPSLLAVGSTYRFSVYVADFYDSIGLSSSIYAIANESFTAGGGYVDGTQTINPATDTSSYVDGAQAANPATAATVVLTAEPDYNNAVFTDQNTVAQVNNDYYKTASTIDPVSTVTGNNFHDETDVVVKGRGLNVALTRTYNSATSSTALDRGLGFGWSHSYLMQLKSNDYGSCPNCTSAQAADNGTSKTSSITYTDERGGDHNYLVNESTLVVTPPIGEFDQMVFNQGIATPGAPLVASTGHYTIVFRNGTRYEFANTTGCDLVTTIDCTARLTRIDEPAGNMLTFNYDANGRLTTVVDNIGTGRIVLTFVYDSATGRLTSVTDLTSRVWQYAYDGSGNLTSMTNPFPATITYTYYTGTHNLKDIVLPEMRGGTQVTTTFQYYQNGRAFNYKDILGNTETLDYDLFRRSTRVTDPRGGVRTYEYDKNGALTKLTEPDGGILLFSMNPDGLRYQKYNALGYGTTYSYRSDRSFNTASDLFGVLTREQDALAQNIDRDYGIYDQLAHVKDKRGIDFYSEYYPSTGSGGVVGKLKLVKLGSLTSNGAIYADVTFALYTYNPDGTPATKTEYLDPADLTKTRVTNYTWIDSGLNLQSMSITGSGQTVSVSYTYDTLGRKKSETLVRRANPAGGTVSLTTTYDYDALDRVTRVTDALGNQFQVIYDKNGKVYQTIAYFKKPDASYETRVLATRNYDGADRMISETDTYGYSTLYTYNAAGKLQSALDPNNHITQFEYDAMNRMTATIDASGYQRQTVYDLDGQPVTGINPLGKKTSTAYDALGRPTKITDALGFITTMTYDANGNLTCVIDANANAGLQPTNTYGCTLYKQYDELNRPVLTVNAENGQTQYAYDLLGNVLSLTDPMSHTWYFAFDNLGRQVGMTDPNGKSQSYQVDEASNTWQRTDRMGRTTNYTYDNLNRLTRVDYLSDTRWETYGFDYRGDLTDIANREGLSYTYTYDNKHRLTAKTDNRTSQTMSYTYDAAGNPKQKTTYTGDVINYQYDSTRRLISEQSPGYLQVSYQYDGAGRLLTRTLSSGAQTAYVWDDANRLTSITNSSASGAPVTQTTYTRDRLGNVLSKTEGANFTTYSYDPLYRLISADAPGTTWDDTYTYDKVGNRMSFNRNGSAVHYEYDPANRLTKTRTGSASGPVQYQFTYDFEGNLRTKKDAARQLLLSLDWNAKNQPISLVAGTNTNSFSYDPLGYRVSKTDSQGNKTYLLEGEHLEAVYSGLQLQAKYMRGGVIDEVVNAYQYDTSGNWINTTYHHDPQTSVIGLSGHNGDVYNLTAYAPFGETEEEAGPVKNFLKYTGREQDQDSGLYQYRARYYDPSIGRFISEDPKGFAGSGVNFYAYVGNNPVNGNDPTGREIVIPPGPDQAALVTLTENTLAMMQQTSVGQQVLNFVLAPAVSVTVQAGPKWEALVTYQPGSFSVPANGPHTITANLSYTPNLLGYFPGSGTWQIVTQSQERALGHELAHVTGALDSGQGSMNLITNFENPMFAPFDGYVRGSYVSFDTLPVGPASPGIVDEFYNSWASPLRLNSLDTFDTGIYFESDFLGGGDIFSDFFSGGFGIFSDFFSGGFVIYPNKSNNNGMSSVYSKP